MVEGAADSTTTVVDAGILGVYRDITLSAPDNGDMVTGGVLSQTVNVGGDYLAVANAPGVLGTVTVVWDGFTDVDFTLGGVNDYITVGVLSIDTSTTVSFTLDDGTNVVTVGPQAFGAPGTFQVSLASFAGVDVTSIDTITMTLTGSTVWDGVFDVIETSTGIGQNRNELPLPAPLSLMGLGLLGLALSRRKA